MDVKNQNEKDDLGYGAATTEGTDEGVKRVQDATSGLVEKAMGAAETRVSGQVSAASDSLLYAADAIRQSGQTLREQDQTQVATVAETAAEQVERVATYLQGRDARQLMGDVEDVARRQPVLFLAGGLALGMLAARLLKSSGGGSSSPETQAPTGAYDFDTDPSAPAL